MNPPQLRHTDMQCGAETDRRAQPARHRHRHSQALALGRGLSALVAEHHAVSCLGRWRQGNVVPWQERVSIAAANLAFQICHSGSSGRLGDAHATVGISVSRLEVWRSTTALPHTLIYRGPAVRPRGLTVRWGRKSCPVLKQL